MASSASGVGGAAARPASELCSAGWIRSKIPREGGGAGLKHVPHGGRMEGNEQEGHLVADLIADWKDASSLRSR
jgi:hypothetical protein